MSADRKYMHPKARTRRSNGRDRFLDPAVDGRTLAARRHRDLERAFIADLGLEPDSLSEAQRLLIAQAASVGVRLEFLQSEIAAGGRDVDDELLVRLSNAQCRLLKTVAGLRVRAAPKQHPEPLSYAHNSRRS